MSRAQGQQCASRALERPSLTNSRKCELPERTPEVQSSRCGCMWTGRCGAVCAVEGSNTVPTTKAAREGTYNLNDVYWIGCKPNTHYKITDRKHFVLYAKLMESINLRMSQRGNPDGTDKRFDAGAFARCPSQAPFVCLYCNSRYCVTQR